MELSEIERHTIFMKKRITYFDTYRFIAAMMIFLSHYIMSFSRPTFRYFHQLPYSIILEGIRGSLGVAILCVILGYFAYKKGESSTEPLVTLSLKRYVYFVVMAVVYYAIALATGWLRVGGGAFNTVKVLLKEALLLSDTYNGLFWTLVPMLIGSMLCYILGRARMQTGGIIVMCCAILLTKDTTVFNCILGCFVAVWQDDRLVKKLMKPWYVQLAAIVVTYALIRVDHESLHLYVLQGVFTVALLVVTMNNDRLARIMGAKAWTAVNRSYFSLFIFHSLLYHNLGAQLMYMEGSMPFKLRFVLVFLLITLIIIVLSKPLDKLVGFITKHINKLIDKAGNRVSARLAEEEAKAAEQR